MGIKDLFKVKKEGKNSEVLKTIGHSIELSELTNSKVLIDASNIIYASLSVLTEQLTYNGEITTHIKIVKQQIEALNKHNITQIWVFDYDNRESIKNYKGEIIVQDYRKCISEVKELLLLIGISYIVAPRDLPAEQFAVILQYKGYGKYIISNDGDVLMCRGDLIKKSKGVYTLYQHSEVLDHLDVSAEEFTFICLLLGYDTHKITNDNKNTIEATARPKGYGPASVIKLMRTEKIPEEIVRVYSSISTKFANYVKEYADKEVEFVVKDTKSSELQDFLISKGINTKRLIQISNKAPTPTVSTESSTSIEARQKDELNNPSFASLQVDNNESTSKFALINANATNNINPSFLSIKSNNSSISQNIQLALANLDNTSIALDVETTFDKENPSTVNFLQDKVRLIQLCDINGTHFMYDLFNPNLEKDIDIIIKFLDSCVEFIGHNLVFDFEMLRPLGFEASSSVKIWDTLTAELVLAKGNKSYLTGDNNKLNTVLKHRINITISKDLQDSNWSGELSNEQLDYARNDVLHLHKLKEAQKELLEKEKLIPIMELESELVKSLVAMRYNGIRIDIKQIDVVSQTLEDKCQQLMKAITPQLHRLTKPLDIRNKNKNDEFKDYLKSQYNIELSVLNRKNIEPYFEKHPELGIIWIMRDMKPEYWTEEMKECIPQIDLDIANNLTNPNVLLKYIQKYIDASIKSTSKKTLQHYFEQYPILETICDYKKNTNFKTTLIKQLKEQVITKGKHKINDEQSLQDEVWCCKQDVYDLHAPSFDRIYPSFLPFGTDTGRFSCKNPNLQGLPRDKRCRNLVIARPGYKLVVCDYSQIELRVAAQIMDEKEFIRAFNNNEDLHVKTAAYVLNTTVEALNVLSKSSDPKDISEFKKARTLAKAVNFGLLYGMGATKFKEYSLNNYGVSLTIEQAKEYRDGFLTLYKDIKKAHIESSFETRNCKVGQSQYEVKTIMGRKRILNNRFFTGYLNTPVQGSSGDMTKLAYTYLYKAVKDGKLPYDFVACIHDEIILEVLASEAVKAAKLLQECMETAGRKIITVVPIIAEPVICDKWGEKDDDALIKQTAKDIMELKSMDIIPPIDKKMVEAIQYKANRDKQIIIRNMPKHALKLTNKIKSSATIKPTKLNIGKNNKEVVKSPKVTEHRRCPKGSANSINNKNGGTPMAFVTQLDMPEGIGYLEQNTKQSDENTILPENPTVSELKTIVNISEAIIRICNKRAYIEDLNEANKLDLILQEKTLRSQEVNMTYIRKITLSKDGNYYYNRGLHKDKQLFSDTFKLEDATYLIPYVPKRDKLRDMLIPEAKNRLGDNQNQMLIVEYVYGMSKNNKDNARNYMVFYGYYEYLVFLNKLPQTSHCFNEVILLHKPQKARWDIDINLDNEAKVVKEGDYYNGVELSMEDISKGIDNLIINNIIPNFKKLYDISLKYTSDDKLRGHCKGDEDDILKYSSHGSTDNGFKFSYHIVIDNYAFANLFEAKWFYYKVSKSYRKKDVIFNHLDNSIYTPNKSLRILYSYKRSAYDRPKMREPSNKYTYFYRSLITYTNYCKILPAMAPDVSDVKTAKNTANPLDEDLDWIQEVITTNISPNLEVQFNKIKGCFLPVRNNGGFDCPICNVHHDNDNMYIVLQKDSVWLYCHRAIDHSKTKTFTSIDLRAYAITSESKARTESSPIAVEKTTVSGKQEVERSILLADEQSKQSRKAKAKSKTKLEKEPDTDYGDMNLYFDRDTIKELFKQLEGFKFIDENGNHCPDKIVEYTADKIIDYSPLLLSDKPVTICIWSGMGTEKTRTIAGIMQKDDYGQVLDILDNLVLHKGKHYLKRVEFISSRYTFACSVKDVMKTEFGLDFVLYKEKDLADRKDISLVDRYIVQCESLNRAKKNIPDLLIIDENTSVSEQITSVLHGLKLKDNQQTYSIHLRQTPKVVFMDADQDIRSTECISKYRKGIPLHIQINNKKLEGHTAYECDSPEQWFWHVRDNLKKGQRIMTPSGSKNFGLALGKWLESPDMGMKHGIPGTREKPANYLYIHADTDDEIKAELNVKDKWVLYLYVIFTGAITNGIDFNEEHFDTIMLYCVTVSLHVRMMKQMMGRARKNSSKTIYYVITCPVSDKYKITLKSLMEERNNYLATHTGEVVKAIENQEQRSKIQNKIDKYSKYIDNESGEVVLDEASYFTRLWIRNSVEKNLSKRHFPILWKKILTNMGYELKNSPKRLTENELLALGKYLTSFRSAVKQDRIGFYNKNPQKDSKAYAAMRINKMNYQATEQQKKELFHEYFRREFVKDYKIEGKITDYIITNKLLKRMINLKVMLCLTPEEVKTKDTERLINATYSSGLINYKGKYEKDLIIRNIVKDLGLDSILSIGIIIKANKMSSLHEALKQDAPRLEHIFNVFKPKDIKIDKVRNGKTCYTLVKDLIKSWTGLDMERTKQYKKNNKVYRDYYLIVPKEVPNYIELITNMKDPNNKMYH